MSNLKYVYLLRNPETGNIIRRVYGHKQCAMSIDELFKLMRRGMQIASPFRFQIGVQISSEKDTKTVWQKNIYTTFLIKIPVKTHIFQQKFDKIKNTGFF